MKKCLRPDLVMVEENPAVYSGIMLPKMLVKFCFLCFFYQQTRSDKNKNVKTNTAGTVQREEER